MGTRINHVLIAGFLCLFATVIFYAVASTVSAQTGGNQFPIADAGPDQRVKPGREVTLDGSNSFDPDDGIAAYQWHHTDVFPPRVTLTNDRSARATFTAPDIADGSSAFMHFELTVTDNSGFTSTDICTVHVENTSGGGGGGGCFINSIRRCR